MFVTGASLIWKFFSRIINSLFRHDGFGWLCFGKSRYIARATISEDRRDTATVKTLFGSLKRLCWRYDGKQLMTHIDIAEGVKREFKKNKVEFRGSVSWYGVCVKNHLEATGVMETYMEKSKRCTA